MTTEEFAAREALIARADIDEDWLASLGLAIVPAWEVAEPNHRDAILAVLLAGQRPDQLGAHRPAAWQRHRHAHDAGAVPHVRPATPLEGGQPPGRGRLLDV